MRFRQLDRITVLEPGLQIEAVKHLTGSEDYLRDHFPNFPVMPGVLMLEAMFQASAWLIRKSEDFANSVVILKEARNVKYADFVQPGQTLVVGASVVRQDEDTTTLKAQGTVDGIVAVSGRLILERYNIADRFPSKGGLDDFLRRKMKKEFAKLVDSSSERGLRSSDLQAENKN
jgi:3-hydroxyacyl-[acyl-carrier-protein] dehydratase